MYTAKFLDYGITVELNFCILNQILYVCIHLLLGVNYMKNVNAHIIVHIMCTIISDLHLYVTKRKYTR